MLKHVPKLARTRLKWHQATIKRFVSSSSSNIIITQPRLSTVHQGNAFEERSLAILHQTMSMSLKRVGGREDGGIDLLGWWWLPPTMTNEESGGRRRIRVIGQCKAEKKKTGPKYIRELEGVLFRFLTSGSRVDIEEEEETTSSQSPIIALLISESEFSKSAILRANSSPIPFFLLHLPAIENPAAIEDGDLGNMGMALCNPALRGADGLLKGDMELRWERHEFGGGGRPALWWRDRKLDSWTPA